MRIATRWNLGVAGLAAGLIISACASVAFGQTAGAPIATPLTWSQWLQNFANLMKVGELGAFVFSAYQFWAGRRERRAADAAAAEQATIDGNYQAWQVINSAQGKGGSGGRLEALRDLLRNGVSLAGINLDDAWLEGVVLPRATLVRGSLRRANLVRANLAGANLEGADLRDAELVGANLAGAYLRGANLTNARLSAAIIDGADLHEVIGWQEVRSISHASIAGVHHAPVGFVAFARQRGAVDGSTPAAQEQDGDGEGHSFSREFHAI